MLETFVIVSGEILGDASNRLAVRVAFAAS
jgi:hypothetical protein